MIAGQIVGRQRSQSLQKKRIKTAIRRYMNWTEYVNPDSFWNASPN